VVDRDGGMSVCCTAGPIVRYSAGNEKSQLPHSSNKVSLVRKKKPCVASEHN